MSTYLDACDDCGTCLGCGRRWCPQETPSPGEGDGLCVECWLAEDGETAKPDEPTGRYAVVLDDEDNEWLRMPGGMWHEQHTGTRAEEYHEFRINRYADISAIRVLSEGVAR